MPTPLSRTLTALALGLALSGTPASVSGQAGLRPLAPGHWTYALAREMDHASWSGAWVIRGRPVLGDDILSVFDGQGNAHWSAFTDAWRSRLREELGVEGRGRLGVGAGVDKSDAKPRQTSGAFGVGLLDVPLGRRAALWADGIVSSEQGMSTLRSGGVSFGLGGVQFLAGRIQARGASGVNSILLNGNVPFDGVRIASRRPFTLPGALSGIGRFQAHLMVAPNVETTTLSSSWFGSYGLSWEPVPSLSFGALRTVRFAGEGLAPFTAGNLWNMFVFGGGDSDFDDSQGELSMRARIRLGAVRVGTYLTLGFEDLSSITEDPALIGGFSVPMMSASGLVSIGYEFIGIGRRADWCGCDYVSHRWYTQREFGEYSVDGRLLGAPLGGYGAGHYLTASFWSTPHPLRIRARVLLEDREASNLLEERWPGSRTGVQVGVGVGPWRGLTITGEVTTTSTDLGSESGVVVTVSAYDLYGLLSAR